MVALPQGFAFNALVKKAKEILAFCPLKRSEGEIKNNVTELQLITKCAHVNDILCLDGKWFCSLYHETTIKILMVPSAALVPYRYCTALGCQGWTHTALQRRCPPPKCVWDGWQQVSQAQIRTENRQKHPRTQTVLLQCARNTLLLGQSTNQNVMLRKITSSCTLI